MSDSIFQEGGLHNFKRTGQDEFSVHISLPIDSDGMAGRECSSDTCEPGYFKVRLGTGLSNQEFSYCPYCCHKDDPQSFHTKEQCKYAENILNQEIHKGVDRMMADALDLDSSGKKTISTDLFSLSISLDTPIPPAVPRPLEQELRRNLTCPHCKLEHSVYGLASWCPDCGKDIFLTHVQGEFEIIRIMTNDIDSRRERLGPRVAAKDIENSLEDVVSTFEAVLRVITRKALLKLGKSQLDIDHIMKSKVANKYQNIHSGDITFYDLFGFHLFESLSSEHFDWLASTFGKRHPITHNLGIIDRKYLQKARSGELEGREIRIQVPEIIAAIDLCTKSITAIYLKLLA
jgi:hypothetical protein